MKKYTFVSNKACQCRRKDMSVSVGDTLGTNSGIDPVIVIKSIIQTISCATLKYIYNYVSLCSFPPVISYEGGGATKRRI